MENELWLFSGTGGKYYSTKSHSARKGGFLACASLENSFISLDRKYRVVSKEKRK
jgi:hypothetical protein